MGAEQRVVERAAADQAHARLIDMGKHEQVVDRSDQPDHGGTEQQGLDDFTAVAHQQVAPGKQQQRMKHWFELAGNAVVIRRPPTQAQHGPGGEQQQRNKNRLAEQLLEFPRTQAKGNQRWNAEQTIKQLVVNIASWQKEQRAQEQEIAEWKNPQANEIEDSIGCAIETAELHAERFNPEVDRPFWVMAI